jgi:SOS response associated peptidase (SRAP)
MDGQANQHSPHPCYLLVENWPFAQYRRKEESIPEAPTPPPLQWPPMYQHPRNQAKSLSSTFKNQNRPFTFAGLWENWKDSETEKWIRTCTIITGEPNELVAQIHPRMPVIIPEQHHAAWLGETDVGKVKELLVPYPADQMRMWEISPRVNSPKNDDPSLWEPLRSEPAKTEAETFVLVP